MTENVLIVTKTFRGDSIAHDVVISSTFRLPYRKNVNCSIHIGTSEGRMTRTVF